MNKKMYYEVDFCRCKTSTEKTMLHKFAENYDCIEWYDDGENVFIGVCNLSEKDVIAEIVKTTGIFKSEFAMWY